MHSGYFWIRPRYPATCFLGPCFKLFRIINELNRIRACRLPHCPRSAGAKRLLSLQIYWLPGYQRELPARRREKERERERERRMKNARYLAGYRHDKNECQEAARTKRRRRRRNGFPIWPNDTLLERDYSRWRKVSRHRDSTHATRRDQTRRDTATMLQSLERLSPFLADQLTRDREEQRTRASWEQIARERAINFNYTGGIIRGTMSEEITRG